MCCHFHLAFLSEHHLHLEINLLGILWWETCRQLWGRHTRWQFAQLNKNLTPVGFKSGFNPNRFEIWMHKEINGWEKWKCNLNDNEWRSLWDQLQGRCAWCLPHVYFERLEKLWRTCVPLGLPCWLKILRVFSSIWKYSEKIKLTGRSGFCGG